MDKLKELINKAEEEAKTLSGNVFIYFNDLSKVNLICKRLRKLKNNKLIGRGSFGISSNGRCYISDHSNTKLSKIIKYFGDLKPKVFVEYASDSKGFSMAYDGDLIIGANAYTVFSYYNIDNKQEKYKDIVYEKRF